MNKTFKIILAALMVIGAVVAYFTDLPMAEYLGLAVSFGSAGALCSGMIAKSEKKDWKLYLSMSCIALSCFGLGFAGVATDTMTKLISAIAGVVLLVIGIITSLKLSEKK